MRIEAELKYDDRCFAKRGGMHASEGVIAISLKNIDLSLRRIADAMERGEKVETVVDIEAAAAQAVITEMREDANNNPHGGHYTSYEIHRYADKLCDALERRDAPPPDLDKVVCAKYPCRSVDCGTNRCNAVFCKGFKAKVEKAEKRRSAK